MEEQPLDIGIADWQLAAISFLAAGFIRLLGSSLRRRHHGDAALREAERRDERIILAFWHSDLLMMPYCYRGRGVAVLSSHSKDGEIMARTLRRLGISTSRGSTSRGGAVGLRALLRKAAEGSDIAFTPDGPRGPAKEVKPGVIQAAAMTGFPIHPVALAATRYRAMKSWDEFKVPLPLSTLHFVYGEPLRVDRRADVEAAAAELKRRLDGVTAEAERLAGRPPGTRERI